MQDAQRIDRILADISLCNRIDGADLRSIVQRLHDHSFDENRASLDQCLGFLDDDIKDSAVTPDPDAIELDANNGRGEFDRASAAMPLWMSMTGGAS